MTTDHTDPVDNGPDLATDPRAKPGATDAQLAELLYESVRAALWGLQAAADHTKAKNYVALGFEGMRLPFDRAEIHLIRPGGFTPTQLVDSLKADVQHERDTAHRHIMANAEISVLLAQRIMDGDPIAVTTDEDHQRVYDGLKASNVVLLKSNCKAAADGMLLLALVKDIREVITARVLGHADEAEEVAALTKINDTLETMGIAL